MRKLLLIIIAMSICTPWSAKTHASKEINRERLITCSNAIRSEHGLSPLTANDKLTFAAYAKLQDMADHQYWAHHNPKTNKKAWEFIDESSYNYMEAGENLAIGFSYAEDICDAWKNSPAHRENLLKSSFEDVGFGIQEVDLGNDIKGNLIVQFFGKEYKPLQQFLSSVTGQRLYGSAVNGSADEKDCISNPIPSLKMTYPPCENPLPPLDKIIIYNPNNIDLSLELNNNPWKMKSVYSHGDFVRYNPQIPLEDGYHQFDVQSSAYPSNKQRRDLFIMSENKPTSLKVQGIQMALIKKNKETTRIRILLQVPEIKNDDLKEQHISIITKTGEIILQATKLNPLDQNRYFAEFEIKNEKLKNTKNHELLFSFVTEDNKKLTSRSPFRNHYRLAHHSSASILGLQQHQQAGVFIILLSLGTLVYAYWRRKSEK